MMEFWPQWTMIVLLIFRAVCCAIRFDVQSESKGASIGASIGIMIAAGIMFYILYAGGFFEGMI